MKRLILLALLASCASQHKFTEKEKDIFRQETLLRTSESVIKKKYNSATAQCYRGDIKKGLTQLKKSYAKQHKTAQYWNSVGTCYLLGNDQKKARFYYKIGLSFNPNDPQILNNLAYMLIQKKKYYKAYDYLKKVNQKSDYLVGRFNLAQMHYYFNKHRKSLALLETLYQLNPKDPDVNLMIGKNLIYLNNYKKADFHFRQVPERFRDQGDYISYYGFNLMKLGQLDKAKEVLGGRIPGTDEFSGFKNNVSLLVDQKIKEKEVRK